MDAIPGPTIYVDADACPVKAEVYKVAKRLSVRVRVAANATLAVPPDSRIELIVCPGFGAADDWIAEHIRPNDVFVTADVPLAARCVAAGATGLDPKGRPLSPDTIGEALAVRDLMTDLRQAGATTGGPAPMTPKDRSRFLAKLDELLVAARRRVK